MPIYLLPEGTVRRLGSSLVISSPVLLLKELLDNAIDSGATSIEVLVSSNTVDKIEVRDNGHGINPDDFDSLGRPGHTSKLRSFEELAGLGGSTLGFRGVALASANVLADVSLTTRVSTEQVAAVLSLANQGGVGTQGHACAPVGTTVRVTGLFSRLPVRSQVAVKEAPKSLAKMKELMQTHALTRPWIRLRFTVLKALNLSWSYAPAPNSGVREAAMQLFGTELASQCVLETFPSESRRPEPSNFRTTLDSSHDQATGLVFEALLPIPGADTLRITKGAFFSVDSRPVSATRGTAKKLLSIFKRRLGDHIVRCRSGEIPKDPFIWLNVRCPPGSYDVNVEPSKEDVFFKEEHLILDQFESFLSSIYLTSDRRESAQPLSVDAAITDGEKPSGTHLGVFQRLPSQATPPSWRVDMSSGFDGLSNDGNDTDDLPPSGRQLRGAEHMCDTPEAEVGEGNMGQNSKEGLNPWSIAKLTSTCHRRSELIAGEPEQEIIRETELPPLGHNYSTGADATSSLTRQGGLTRELDSRPQHQGRVAQVDNPASPGKPLQDLFEREFRRATVSSTLLSTGQDQPRRNRGLQSPPTSSPQGFDCNGAVPRERPRPRYTAGSGRAVQSRISFDRKSRRRRHHDGGDLELNQLSFENSNMNRRIRDSRHLQIQEAENMMARHVDLNTRRERTLSQTPPPPRPRPHNALDAAEARTETSQEHRRNEDPPQPNLLAEDPRVKLIRQQRSMMQNPQKKPRRLKTEKLPLETIPSGFQTRTLLLTMTVDACQMAQLYIGASQFDTYVVDGKLRDVFMGGAGSESNTVLVQSLLARVGYGSTERLGIN